ncbi:MAG TPA: type II toxin-antitoxin system VapC family toxin, partial [Ktedonobacterales bacterium]|nr:type II toxin-antitoxin system VapC family toxin [Ktedonobacterales bacterium]
MPAYFFDSSALVKRYYRESGTDWVRSICERRHQPGLYLSQLARVEVVAALRRAERYENLHESFVDAMVNTFERHFSSSIRARSTPIYSIVALSPTVLEMAANLCGRYWNMRPNPIRSLDAIQLACAIAASADLADDLIVVTADQRLLAIAALESFHVIHPS